MRTHLGILEARGCNKLENYDKTIEKKQEDERNKYFAEQVQRNINWFVLIGDFLNKQPVYYDKSKMWWVWNKNKCVWELTDEIGILNELRYTFDILGLPKSEIKTQILEALRLVARDRKPQDAPLNWVQFGDIILDIKTMQEFKATPDYFLTNSLPFKPSDCIDTPTIDKIFSDWVGVEFCPTLYEIIAYCCYRDYPVNRLFCLTGSGSNGKGTFLRLIEVFLGKENACSTELENLTSNHFASAGLYKKLVCFMGETNFNQMSRTGLLKKLTGRDLIDFEFKGKQPFSDYNYAKIIICTNTLPTTTDKTDGFYRRWLIIDFLNKFTEKKDILKEIPEQEFNNLSRKLIYILSDLLQKRTFTSEGTIEERRQRFEERSNPLSKFLEQNFEKDINEHIFKFEFKELFLTWLKDNGFRVWNDQEIGRTMKEAGFEEHREIKNIFDKQKQEFVEKYYWAWIGLKLKEKEKL